jgi:hypothetical protein
MGIRALSSGEPVHVPPRNHAAMSGGRKRLAVKQGVFLIVLGLYFSGAGVFVIVMILHRVGIGVIFGSPAAP